nr:MAG TPA: holin [Caudoviricetes sp.]
MDANELINQLITPVGQVALVMALAELFKQAGFDKKYIPIVDVVLGLISGLGVFCLLLHYPVVESVILGLAIGLSACGLFSGVKNITQSVNKGDENNG